MQYPRLCAHRGFSSVAPENSMAAFGAAVALGASEIEFDLWQTADGVIVSTHDRTLERVSDGEGIVTDKTYSELLECDFGVKHGEEWRGLKIVTFEEILRKFAARVVMNVHVKTTSDEYDDGAVKKIVDLVRKYDCEKYVYFMIVHEGVIRKFKEYAPDIPICVGHLGTRPWDIVERAIEVGAEKVQLFKPYFNEEMIKRAHANGIKCNVFFADDIEEAQKYLDMGVDTVLTNDYLKISTATKLK
jgi:glycerophosphoryl diester phosphodiesterase